MSFSMEKSRKRKQQRMGIDDAGGIDRLPDDLVINILSRMSMKRAVRTSVLAHRWRYLWRFSRETLRFDGKLMEKGKFQSWVNGVLDLHQGPYIEGMIISFEGGDEINELVSTSRAFGKWLNFAMQKEVQRLELNLSFEDIYKYKFPRFRYAFPTLDELRSHPHAFCRLRSLRLAHVQISHDVVHYFLASCPDLEELCIQLSYYIQGDLRVVDPPSLRVLEITRCPHIRSLEISAVSLVSLKYGGAKNSLLLKKAPNLRKLCVRGDMCWSFVLEPKEHSSYSVQLEKLVLDFRLSSTDVRISVDAPPDLPRLCSLKRLQVQVFTNQGSSLNFFKSLIEASPHLCEFRIELSYTVDPHESNIYGLPHIVVSKVGKFVHRNLKVVEVSGYIGCVGGHAEELVVALIWSCPSLERVAIDIPTDYYDDPRVCSYIAMHRLYKYSVPFATSREEAKERAQRFIARTRKQKPRLREWKRCQWERLEFIVT